MLDTGIDIPEIVNLVFFKLVRSKTKFWQMMGRGTRLCPDLYGPGEDKIDFFVFDFCQNIEFFNQTIKGSEGSVAESLTQRLFKARLELITKLDGRLPDDASAGAGDGTASETGLRTDMVHLLHEQVAGMNTDNIVVRPQRRWVEIYADLGNWHSLTPDQAIEVGEHLSWLPTAARADDAEDEQAKRFDLLILRLQLAALAAEPGFDRLRAQVQAIATALLEKTNIPAVRAQQELLDEVAEDDWWNDVTLPMLELLRRRVRSLVKLIEKARRIIVYTDLADQLGETAEVTLSGLAVGSDFERFRAKARVYLRANEDHVALQKLRRNRPLTAADLAELERMLSDAGVGGADDIARARRQASGLGLFIRGLVGLDRAAATEALDAFVSGRTLSASQLDFVNLIVAYLTENGTMDAALLYESPFTEIAPRGPESLFSGPDIEQLVAILRHVRSTAAPEEVVA